VIFQFLIKTVPPTYDKFPGLTPILHYTACFLSKPRKQQLSVSVIILF